MHAASVVQPPPHSPPPFIARIGRLMTVAVDTDSSTQPLSSLLPVLAKFPQSATHLSLGRWFNQPLPPLPDSIERLEFTGDFDQPLPAHPPASLRYLQNGDYHSSSGWKRPWPIAWNQAPLHTLWFNSQHCDITALQFPPTLTHLYLCLPPDVDIASKPLPPSLKRVVMWSPRSRPFRGSLALQWPADAPRLERLGMKLLDWAPTTANARLTLPTLMPTQLELPSYHLESPAESEIVPRVDWPLDLSELHVERGVTWLLRFPGLLPSSLPRLRLNCYSDQQPPAHSLHLPSGLRQLRLDEDWGKLVASLDSRWPQQLERLELQFAFDQPLDEWQPPQSITELVFDQHASWNKPTLRCPPNLRRLELSSSFNESLEGLQLPQSLTHLTLGEQFDQSLRPLTALHNLTCLELGDHFKRPLSGDDWSLPTSLRILRLSSARRPAQFHSAPLRSLPSLVGLHTLHLELAHLEPTPHDWQKRLPCSLDQLRAAVSRLCLPAGLCADDNSSSECSPSSPSAVAAAPLPLPQSLRLVQLMWRHVQQYESETHHLLDLPVESSE